MCMRQVLFEVDVNLVVYFRANIELEGASVHIFMVCQYLYNPNPFPSISFHVLPSNPELMQAERPTNVYSATTT
jgi:hypothetical protein